MKQVEFLVEEQSAAELLSHLLPRLLPSNTGWAIHSFAGKADLLRKLPGRLDGYRARLAWQPGLRVLVLVDRDDEDCMSLKSQLESIARSSGLETKSVSKDFVVANRIAIEELEAWYLGDLPALRTLYPRLSSSLGKKAKYRDPDGIAGGTWETLERLLQAHGYEKGGLRKVALASDIGPLLDLTGNTSKSFQAFVAGALSCAR